MGREPSGASPGEGACPPSGEEGHLAAMWQRAREAARRQRTQELVQRRIALEHATATALTAVVAAFAHAVHREEAMARGEVVPALLAHLRHLACANVATTAVGALHGWKAP